MSANINQKEYIVLLGNFGSGKTELSLHFAEASAAAGESTTLVDLDIINTYFRASEKRLALEQKGIRLISPNFAMSNIELITVPAEVYSVFAQGDGTVIFDVGGDANGARAIGQYQPNFMKIDPGRLRVWLVINAHRPMSSTADKVIKLMQETEYNCRLSINGLINNGNLSYETTGQELFEAYDVVKAVSEQTGIPVLMTSGKANVLADFQALATANKLERKFIGELVAIDTQVHRDWHRFVKLGL